MPYTGGGNGDCDDPAWTRMCPETEREQAAIRPLKVEAIRIGVRGGIAIRRREKNEHGVARLHDFSGDDAGRLDEAPRILHG